MLAWQVSELSKQKSVPSTLIGSMKIYGLLNTWYGGRGRRRGDVAYNVYGGGVQPRCILKTYSKIPPFRLYCILKCMAALINASVITGVRKVAIFLYF